MHAGVYHSNLHNPNGLVHLFNSDYDHEAFLGEEAKTFDDLTPEESKSRLAIIVDKIDKDKNGIVTAEELQEWIKFTQKRYIYEVRNHNIKWLKTNRLFSAIAIILNYSSPFSSL